MPKKFIIIGVIVFFFVIILAAVLLTQGGGGNVSTQPVELVWWKTFEDSQNVQPIIEAYTQQHKNVKITYVKKDVATYETELIDAIASGRGPDIFTIHNDWVPKQKAKLAPMPSAMMTERQYRETFVDVASSDFVSEGKIYAMPLSVDALALYYNKDIFNSVGISTPPKTWQGVDSVESAVQKITRQDKNGDFIRSGIAMGMAQNVNRSVDILSLLMLQNGTKFVGDSGEVALDQSITIGTESYNPAAVALDFYTQFANPAKKSYTWNARTDNSVDAFTQGKLGMMISYSYMRDQIAAKAPNLNWGVAELPQLDDSGTKVNFANYWGEAVSKSSKNSAVAWDFINFATQKENLQKLYALHKLPASRRDMLTSQFADLDIGPFAENALTAKSAYKQDSSLFEGIFVKMIEDVVLRNQDPDSAVSSAAQQLNLIPKN